MLSFFWSLLSEALTLLSLGLAASKIALTPKAEATSVLRRETVWIQIRIYISQGYKNSNTV